jgi:hypothetical protein
MVDPTQEARFAGHYGFGAPGAQGPPPAPQLGRGQQGQGYHPAGYVSRNDDISHEQLLIYNRQVSHSPGMLHTACPASSSPRSGLRLALERTPSFHLSVRWGYPGRVAAGISMLAACSNKVDSSSPPLSAAARSSLFAARSQCQTPALMGAPSRKANRPRPSTFL